ncbi:MAG: hypothetical protein A2158_03630 [Chloroflexi bacterium RBG_13_46_14]|nr:MAG: hypothetical protein A2158_03630 [Chloroflexi bacterium RBG_13_46_14]
MVDNLFCEKLNWFKENEKPETVLVIADNQELIKIIVAWTNLKVRIADDLTALSGESENEIWDWLWKNTKFNLSELKLITGTSLSETGLKDKMNPLIGNRILYPDGTINSYVQRYLRERVLKLFEAKPKKSTKKTG